jgi:hypothetical protein
MIYFSDRERGVAPQTATEMTPEAWRGIASLISVALDDGSFGARFPQCCPDGVCTYATNRQRFWEVLRAEIPNLAQNEMLLHENEPPPLLDLMDLIEFCWRSIGRLQQLDYHHFYKHHHISFDVDAGRREFRDEINLIFSRNNLAYTLSEAGAIERLVPVEIGDALDNACFATGDPELDRMLDAARRKFLDPDITERHDALKELWDAWERLKTINGKDKKAGIAELLDQIAGPKALNFRSMLEKEAKQVTEIGNTFQIRHSETTQEPLSSEHHVDYLFHRLFSLINLLLRASRSPTIAGPPQP